MNNKVIKDFADEWKRFDQSNLSNKELKKIFNDYFNIFPMERINKDSEGFDMGAGTGRWANFICPKVKLINLIEPSKAIEIAKRNLNNHKNVIYYNKSVYDKHLQINSQDFGYSLGVLHHVIDTQEALKICSNLLKPNSPFLLYLYYNFENRSNYFKLIWHASNFLRKIISVFPNYFKNIITDIIAFTIYLPLSYIYTLLNYLGFSTNNLPISYYKNKSFYTMRTDARDRFGTSLEKRFSKKEIEQMMLKAGFTNITFSNKEPFWCALGYKK